MAPCRNLHYSFPLDSMAQILCLDLSLHVTSTAQPHCHWDRLNVLGGSQAVWT